MAHALLNKKIFDYKEVIVMEVFTVKLISKDFASRDEALALFGKLELSECFQRKELLIYEDDEFLDEVTWEEKRHLA